MLNAKCYWPVCRCGLGCSPEHSNSADLVAGTQHVLLWEHRGLCKRKVEIESYDAWLFLPALLRWFSWERKRNVLLTLLRRDSPHALAQPLPCLHCSVSWLWGQSSPSPLRPYLAAPWGAWAHGCSSLLHAVGLLFTSVELTEVVGASKVWIDSWRSLQGKETFSQPAVTWSSRFDTAPYHGRSEKCSIFRNRSSSKPLPFLSSQLTGKIFWLVWRLGFLLCLFR